MDFIYTYISEETSSCRTYEGVEDMSTLYTEDELRFLFRHRDEEKREFVLADLTHEHQMEIIKTVTASVRRQARALIVCEDELNNELSVSFAYYDGRISDDYTTTVKLEPDEENEGDEETEDLHTSSALTVDVEAPLGDIANFLERYKCVGISYLGDKYLEDPTYVMTAYPKNPRVSDFAEGTNRYDLLYSCAVVFKDYIDAHEDFSFHGFHDKESALKWFKTQETK